MNYHCKGFKKIHPKICFFHPDSRSNQTLNEDDK